MLANLVICQISKVVGFSRFNFCSFFSIAAKVSIAAFRSFSFLITPSPFSAASRIFSLIASRLFLSFFVKPSSEVPVLRFKAFKGVSIPFEGLFGKPIHRGRRGGLFLRSSQWTLKGFQDRKGSLWKPVKRKQWS